MSLGPPSRKESAREIAIAGGVLGLLIPPLLPKRTAAFVRGRDEGRLLGIGVGTAVGAFLGFLHPYEWWQPGVLPER